MFFFVNDTPTTEIYPYLHPLSLHDALPIFRARLVFGIARGLHIARRRDARCDLGAALGRRREDEVGGAQIGRAHAELQSLMRISYAVFCLKKKTRYT